jgi:hypothetical protein
MLAATCRPAGHRRERTFLTVAGDGPRPRGATGVGEAVRPLAHALRHCPSCHAGPLQTAFDGRSVNLLCQNCGGCWKALGSRTIRIDPATCAGCPARGSCRAAPPVTGPPAAA